MTCLRDILIFALCILLALAPAVSANSGPMTWEGSVGTGSLVVEEDSPIVAEKEVLTFDIRQFPAEYYSTESALEEYYGATVTAEYTFRNPTDADVTATLLFPYGLMPDYVNVYAEEHAGHSQEPLFGKLETFFLHFQTPYEIEKPAHDGAGFFVLAGETRIEHATHGFGDRCSTS